MTNIEFYLSIILSFILGFISVFLIFALWDFAEYAKRKVKIWKIKKDRDHYEELMRFFIKKYYPNDCLTWGMDDFLKEYSREKGYMFVE